jgi:hypothetical protein
MGDLVPGFVLYGALAYAVVQCFKFAFRVAASVPGLICIAFYLLVYLPFGHLYSARRAVPESVVIAHIDRHDFNTRLPGTPSSRIPVTFDSIIPSEEVPVTTVTFQSTFVKPYQMGALTCIIEGPIFYYPDHQIFFGDKQEYDMSKGQGQKVVYIGTRRMVVRLVPLSWLDPGYTSAVPAAVPPAWSASRDPVSFDIHYLIATTYQTYDDDTFRCGKDDGSPFQIEWIGPHANMPIERLVDPQRDAAIIQRIAAAAAH